MTTQKTHAALAAHTPGPWTHGAHAHAGEPVITDAHGHNIAFCNADRPEDEANARLIAAAPDLLAALSGLLELTEAMRDTIALEPGLSGLLQTNSPRISAARAALAKAKGIQ